MLSEQDLTELESTLLPALERHHQSSHAVDGARAGADDEHRDLQGTEEGERRATDAGGGRGAGAEGDRGGTRRHAARDLARHVPGGGKLAELVELAELA